MVGISVTVCTFNRANLLGECLASLCSQTLNRSKFEILVVDNNSTDQTRRVVEGFTENHPNVRYLHEPKQGLSHARNRGWREAKGEYVGYFDDDSRAPDRWLELAHRIIVERGPHIFGGPYYPFYESPKPHWFKDDYQTGHNGPEPRFLSKGEWLSGTNIFFKRQLLEDLDGFRPDHGMRGYTLGYGEETAVIVQAREQIPDVKIFYEPEMNVYHLVPERKVQWGWNLARSFSVGRSVHKAVFGDKVSHTAVIPFLALRLLVVGMLLPLDLVGGTLIRNRNKYPHPQNYVYEHCLGTIRRTGRYYQQLVTSLKRH